MVKIKTFKQTCCHSVTFPSVDTGKNGEGEGLCTHPELHTCVTCMTFCGDLRRHNDRAKAGAHENGSFAYFCEIRSAFVR